MSESLTFTAEQIRVALAAMAGLRAQCQALAAQARDGSPTQEHAVLLIGHCLAIERRLNTYAAHLNAPSQNTAEQPPKNAAAS